MKKSISPIRTLLKLALALFLLFLVLSMTALLGETIIDTISSDEDQRQQERFLEYVAADQYGSLYEELKLYDLYDEEYDCYWQAAEAYHLYCQYDAARKAAEITKDPDFALLCETRAREASSALLSFPAVPENPTVQAAILRIQTKL